MKRKNDEENSGRVRVTTTISVKDKEYLEKAGVNISSALAMGVKTIKKEIGLDIEAPSKKIAAIQNLDIPDVKAPMHTILLKRTLSDEQINRAIEKNSDTLKRLGEVQ